MSKEYRAKVFKSGNSMALRLPKALGFEEGTEMVLREERAQFIMEPLNAPKRKIDVSKFWGLAPWLEPLLPEDRVFDDVKRPWDDPDWPGWPDDRQQ